MRKVIKFKVLTVLLLIVFCSLLHSQETIIDSVYSDMYLDGHITYWRISDYYEVDTTYYSISIGDTGDGPLPPPWDEPNSVFRAYISFDLPQIPEGYHIDSVYVRLYQYFGIGNGGSLPQLDFPEWNIAGGDTVKCIMSHIDYGDELDAGDWEKGDIGNPYTFQNNIGTITESGDVGYRYLDLTSSVLQDYELERDKTQYRISFQIDTDWDELFDFIGISTSNHVNPIKFPILFFHFLEDNSTENYILETNIHQIQVFPNPISTNATFRLTSKENTYVDFSIYNVKGQKIITIYSGDIVRNEKEFNFNSGNLPNGIYFMKAISNKQVATKKILIIH